MKRSNLLPFVMFLLFAGMFTKANAGEVSGGSFSFSENILTLYNSGEIVITYDPNGNDLASESVMYLHLWYKYKWCDKQGDGDKEIPLGGWEENKHLMTKGEDGKFRLTITGTLADYIQAKSSVSDLGSLGASNCPVVLCCIAKTENGQSQSQEGGVVVSNYYKLDFYPENQEARKKSDIYYYYVGETFQYKIEKFLKWNGSEGKTDDKKYVVRLLADDTKIDSIPETATYGNGEYVQSYVWQ
ncbi:MAG: hypothetical protein LBG17_06580, partial [Bacteroidales bacterium]|nr:hypothetical protein [Bacteroidales bacterium]